MAKLYIGIDMFNMNQTLFLEREGEVGQAVAVPLNQLNQTIYHLINEENINEIYIGGNQDFIEKIGYEILDELKLNYSNKNVRIKANDKVLN